MFGSDLEHRVWSRFWNWNLANILRLVLTWDLTIFGNTIGNKDRGEVIARTWFHSFFSRKKSEIWIAFTFFEKWKVKNKIPSLFFEKWKWNWNGSRSRTRSENEKKILENSWETRISLVSEVTVQVILMLILMLMLTAPSEILVSREFSREFFNFHFSFSISSHLSFTFNSRKRVKGIYFSLFTSRKKWKLSEFHSFFSRKKSEIRYGVWPDISLSSQIVFLFKILLYLFCFISWIY